MHLLAMSGDNYFYSLIVLIISLGFVYIYTSVYFTPQIEDAAPSPVSTNTEDDAKAQKSDRSAIQDMLAFLFGE